MKTYAKFIDIEVEADETVWVVNLIATTGPRGLEWEMEVDVPGGTYGFAACFYTKEPTIEDILAEIKEWGESV